MAKERINIASQIIYLALILFSIFCLSNCSKRVQQQTSYTTGPTPIEQFIDSLEIGIRTQNKIEVNKYIEDSCFTDILFYKKQNNAWQLIQKERYWNSPIGELNAEIKDFNNDGYNDFIYSPLVAARGGNIVGSLFIFRPETGSLQYIKNSEQYPNLNYNPKLNCIDSFALYGGSTTSFLRIEEDSLFCFAQVSLFGKGREIVTYDEKGEPTTLLNDTVDNEDYPYIRFSDYNPLIVKREHKEYISLETE